MAPIKAYLQRRVRCLWIVRLRWTDFLIVLRLVVCVRNQITASCSRELRRRVCAVSSFFFSFVRLPAGCLLRYVFSVCLWTLLPWAVHDEGIIGFPLAVSAVRVGHWPLARCFCALSSLPWRVRALFPLLKPGFLGRHSSVFRHFYPSSGFLPLCPLLPSHTLHATLARHISPAFPAFPPFLPPSFRLPCPFPQP